MAGFSKKEIKTEKVEKDKEDISNAIDTIKKTALGEKFISLFLGDFASNNNK